MVLQEDLPHSSLSSASSVSILSQDAPEQELLPDQASLASRADSTLSTPGSLRPGTVPRLDLSPAIALHMASLEGEEEEEEPAHHRQAEEEETATRRQAAAMASFDDLSGPEDSDTASEAASVAPATTAAMSDAGQSMQAMQGMPDVADHASATSSADSERLAERSWEMSTASVAQPRLSMPAAAAASSVVPDEYTREVSGEREQTASAANQAESAVPPKKVDVAASSGNQAAVIGTAHTEATAVGAARSPHATAVDIGSTHVTDSTLPNDAADSTAMAQTRHRLPAVNSDESFTIASSISEDLELGTADSGQEAPPESIFRLPFSHAAQAASANASAVPRGHGSQTEAPSEALLEADDVQLSFESPDASHPMISAHIPLLHPEPADISSLPLLALNISKKGSEDKEQQPLAPDLLAYAEAAMTEGNANADQHALVTGKLAGPAEAAHTAVMSHTEAGLEAAGRSQQADNIAAELFDELLDDAVLSMTSTGKSSSHMPHPASHLLLLVGQICGDAPCSPPPPSRHAFCQVACAYRKVYLIPATYACVYCESHVITRIALRCKLLVVTAFVSLQVAYCHCLHVPASCTTCLPCGYCKLHAVTASAAVTDRCIWAVIQCRCTLPEAFPDPQ